MYCIGAENHLLTASSHATAYCLHEANRAATARCDTALQCMALEKLSTLSHWYAPRQSLQYIDKALSLYAVYSQATFVNRIRLQLAKGELGVTEGTIRRRSYMLKQRLEITDKSVSVRQYLASLV